MATTRAPMIDLDRWTDVAPVLDAALDLDGAARDAFVAAIADTEVRAEVQRFLAHGDSSATETLSSLFGPARPAPLAPGTRLGAYRIEATIGAGGGGTVYRALDVAADKAVAIKVLAASDRDAARVDREIRALSRLDNPGVVRYLAAGTAGPADDDGPAAPTRFLAMELVHGANVVEAADRDGLLHDDRVRLLAETAHAVQAALDRAVLHRDLKPSNVLTARGEDGRLHPKVLDFGIGVLLDEDADEAALRFTPGFAAPEQRRGDPATAATDVYGLGALGAVLLTGAPPQDGLAALGALPRDLGAILRRALADDPADRYENAGALRRDLVRVLERRPVEALPRTAWYAGRLFARRHALALSVAALVLLAAAAAVVQIVQARRATQHEASRAGEIAALLAGAFDAADPFSDEGAEANIRDLLARIERDVADRPVSAGVAWEVEMLLGTSYWGAGAYSDAAEHQQDALQLARAAYGPNDRRAGEVLRRLGETRRS